MKHATLILIVLISGAAKLFAQPYLSYASQWTNEYKVADMTVANPQYSITYTYYYVNGDSVLNNYTYKRIYETHKYCGNASIGLGSPCNSIPHSTPTLKGLLREAGSRWYFRSGAVEDLLYRFDLVKGDTLRNWHDTTHYVIVDTVLLNYQNTGLKYFQIKPQPGVGFPTGIIEGVGPDVGFLSFLFFQFESPIESLVCYSTPTRTTACLPWPELITGIEVQTDAAKQITIYPNPANANLFVTLITPQAGTIKVINAQGQTMQQQNIAAGVQNATIATRDLPEGLYLLQLENADRSMSCRHVIIEH